jgi:hypothetical protein
MKREEFAIRATIAWLFGPIVWATHFFLLYGIASYGCTPPDTTRQGAVRLIFLALSAVALSALIGFLAWYLFGVRQQPGEYLNKDIRYFLRRIANLLAVLAIVGVVWTATGATLIPACVVPGIDGSRPPCALKDRTAFLTASNVSSARKIRSSLLRFELSER